MTAVLEVDDLRVWLPSRGGMDAVVDGIDLRIGPGEVVGVAGESGSGKTITALSLLGLLPHGALTGGRAEFGARNLLTLSQQALQTVRGAEIAMVFQDPMTSLHPMLPIGRQLTEHVRRHLGLSARQARQAALELLAEVRMPDPEASLRAFPHQFSGGMRQRVAIAIALACGPRLLIADEPTTALDVTVQAGILALFDRLRRDSGMSVLFITHDLGVMSAIADRLYVLYAGRVAESGLTSEVLSRPRHPYTRALLDALPHPEDPQVPLTAIPGAPPDPAGRPPGCAYHPRCPYARADCATVVPPLVPAGPTRDLACHVDPFVA